MSPVDSKKAQRLPRPQWSIHASSMRSPTRGQSGQLRPAATPIGLEVVHPSAVEPDSKLTQGPIGACLPKAAPQLRSKVWPAKAVLVNPRSSACHKHLSPQPGVRCLCNSIRPATELGAPWGLKRERQDNSRQQGAPARSPGVKWMDIDREDLSREAAHTALVLMGQQPPWRQITAPR